MSKNKKKKSGPKTSAYFLNKVQNFTGIFDSGNTLSNPTLDMGGGLLTANDYVQAGVGQNSKSQYFLGLYKYLYGKQPNKDYFFLEQAGADMGNGQTIQAPGVWMPGHEIGTLVKYMLNKLESMIENPKIVAKDLTDEAVEAKADLYDKLRIAFTHRDTINAIGQATGVPYEPIKGFNPQSIAEIDDHENSENLSSVEELAQSIGYDLFKRNDLIELAKRIGLDILCNGFSCEAITVENAEVKIRHYPTPVAIIDYSPNSDKNEGMRYWGYIDYLTVGQIKERFDNLSTDTVEELDKLGKSTNSGPFNLQNSAWAYERNGVPHYQVVTLSWIDEDLDNYEEGLNEYGGKIFKPTKRINDFEDTSKKLIRKKVERIYEATVVRGTILLEGGEAKNQVRDKRNPSLAIPNTLNYSPDILFGQTISFVEVIAGKQATLEALDFKISQMLQRDQGLILMMDKSQMPEWANALTAARDMTQLSILEIESKKEGEPTQQSGGKYFDVLDMGLKAEQLRAYLQYRDVIKQELREYASIPQIAMGQQSQVIGKSVQENTVAYAEFGTIGFYKGVIKHLNRVLTRAIEVSQVMMTSPDYPFGKKKFILPQGQAKVLEVTKDFTLSDLHIAVDAFDSLDDATLKRVLAMEEGMIARQGEINPSLLTTYMTTLEKTSLSGLKKYFKELEDKQKREAAQKQQQEQQFAMEQQQSQNQHGINVAQAQSQPALAKVQVEREAIQADKDKKAAELNVDLAALQTKKADTLIKAGADLHKHHVSLANQMAMAGAEEGE